MSDVLEQLDRTFSEHSFQPSAEELLDLIWFYREGYFSYQESSPEENESEEPAADDAPADTIPKPERISEDALGDEELEPEVALPDIAAGQEKPERTFEVSTPGPAIEEEEAGALLREKANADSRRETLAGKQVRVGKGRALPRADQLKPFLRLLGERQPVVNEQRLDAARMVERYCRNGLIWEPCYETTQVTVHKRVTLVIEAKSSVLFWRELGKEWAELLMETTLIPCDTLYLHWIDDDHPVLGSSPFQTEGVDARRWGEMRREGELILVMTDGTSPAWAEKDPGLEFRGGFHVPRPVSRFGGLLHGWSRHRPVTILLPFSFDLAARTHLKWSDSELGVVDSHTGQARWVTGGNTRHRPVLMTTLDPDDFEHWAAALAPSALGVSDAVLLRARQTDSTAPGVSAEMDLVSRFRRTASRRTQELASFLAAVPLYPPIMRLIQEARAPYTDQSHLAEFLYSGLVRRCPDLEPDTDPEEVLYELVPVDGDPRYLRNALLDGITREQMIESLALVGEYAESLGLSRSTFDAFLAGKGNVELDKVTRPFALVYGEVMQRIAGQYVQAGKQLEANARTVASDKEKPESPEEEKSPGDEPFSEPPPDLENSAGMTMIGFGPGTFNMGSPEAEAGRDDDDMPLHEVTLTQPFHITKSPVTQGQWQVVMGTTLEEQKAKESSYGEITGKGEAHPMYFVNWEDALRFCDEMTRRDLVEGKITEDHAYSLPTEAQWEFSCRAGVEGAYNVEGAKLHDLGWFSDNSESSTQPVGQKLANSKGLHDCHGNVWEWCSDWFAKSDSGEAVTDPEGPASGGSRVIRGGSCDNAAQSCRSACRGRSSLGRRLNSIGFRPVLTTKEQRSSLGELVDRMEVTGQSDSRESPEVRVLDLSGEIFSVQKERIFQSLDTSYGLASITIDKMGRFFDWVEGNLNALAPVENAFDFSDSHHKSGNDQDEVSLNVSARLQRGRLSVEAVFEGSSWDSIGEDTDSKHTRLFEYILLPEVEQWSGPGGLTFNRIPAGTFTMGSPETEEGRVPTESAGNETQHEVELTQEFWMAETPVTQGQWMKVMGGKNPSDFQKSGDDAPVDQVSWEDAIAFCTKLNDFEENEEWEYALPTEAQWEYACRAGTAGPYNVEGKKLEELGWFEDNSEYKTHPVKGKLPNAHGLFDMHGNIAEWCQDYFQGDLGSEPQKDPTGPKGGDGYLRVRRGGSWVSHAGHCRSALRSGGISDSRYSTFGFRPVRRRKTKSAEEPELEAGTKSAPEVGARSEALREQDFENQIGMKMLRLESGTFTMGEGEEAHPVTLTEDFYIAETPVTQSQWERVMGNTPSKFKLVGGNAPVENVSWEDAFEYCDKLNQTSSPPEGWEYGLPTEAQWEYSCRAGTTTNYWWGDLPEEGKGNFGNGNIAGNQKEFFDSQNLPTDSTMPVHTFEPNPWGLYDVAGNIWEYCLDWYSTLSREARVDPGGPKNGEFHVVRGGSWNFDFRYVRSSARRRCNPGDRNDFCGLRPVLKKKGEDSEKGSESKEEESRAKADTRSEESQKLDFTNSVGERMICLPPGTFIMGSPPDEAGREPGSAKETQHKVTLTESAWMAKTPVTQGQWRELMGTTVAEQNVKEGGTFRRFTGVPVGYHEDYPMVLVNWEEAMNYCDALTLMEIGEGRIREDMAYTLPTEAQWEYACRAGTTGSYSGGNLDEMGWYDANSGHSIHPVGEKAENPWGLQDMHGSCYEWCADMYQKNLGNRAVTDPQGPPRSRSRVIRGGSWQEPAESCRSAFRVGRVPAARYPSVGFRPVLTNKKQRAKLGELQTELNVPAKHEPEVHTEVEKRNGLSEEDAPVNKVDSEVVLNEEPKSKNRNLRKVEWYYTINMEQIGPSSLEELRTLFGNGELIGEFLWKEGMPDWQPADQILPELLGVSAPMERRVFAGTRKSGPVGMTFVSIPAGTFLMGSPTDEYGRSTSYVTETQHEVTLTQGFEIADTPVTQGQWKEIMGNNPSTFSRIFGTKDLPVENVSWEDAVRFCDALSNRNSEYDYALPTEAQWEYACRAGTKGPLNIDGDDSYLILLDELGWYDYNSKKKTHPVKKKRPNTWNIYDMHGNVREWCADWLEDDLGPNKQTDPGGFERSVRGRVNRGGSYGSPNHQCRSASRNSTSPDHRSDSIGFRPVRTRKELRAKLGGPKAAPKAAENIPEQNDQKTPTPTIHCFFESNSAYIIDSEIFKLQKIVEQERDCKIKIQGLEDLSSSNEYKVLLSSRRVLAITKQLGEFGVPSERLETKEVEVSNEGRTLSPPLIEVRFS